MGVTLEQTQILVKEMKMAPSEYQHCLDTMRRYLLHAVYWCVCVRTDTGVQYWPTCCCGTCTIVSPVQQASFPKSIQIVLL